MDWREGRRIFPIALATIFLLLGSYFVFGYINKSVAKRRNTELQQTLDEIIVGTQEKINLAVDIAYDLRGLLLHDQVIDAKEWENFITATDIDVRFPGVYSFAFAQVVEKKDLESFEQNLRKEDGPNYKNYLVFPKSNNAEYFPIKYLHTTDPDIAVLLGFDFRYSDRSVQAFTQAVQTDQPTMSELTHLDLVIPYNKKTGYEVVLPVYNKPSIKDFPLEERRKYLTGFVGAWISPENLNISSLSLSGLKYTLKDGNDVVYTDGKIGNTTSITTKNFQILNKSFNITLESDKTFTLSSFEESLPTIVFVGVLLINGLWLMSVFSILTSRKRAIDLAELATKDLRKFKQAVDGVSDHVIITDPDGVIVYANKAATEITGYSVDEMIGMRPNLWGGQMPKEFYQRFWHTIKDEKRPFTGEINNRRKNGELYEVELRVSPILDKNGNLIFFVGIERDLSRFRAIEKMKSEFISLASHQLRTPLSAAKWFTEMLMNGDAGKLTDLQKSYVEKIDQSNEREIHLVNSLLNVSRVESGKIVVLPKPTDLKKMLEEMFAEQKVNMEGKQKIFEYDIDKKLPMVEMDVDLIKHVYSNLITNAMNYTKPGDKIKVKVFVKGEYIVSEVSDTGIGVPKEEKERIFEKFFRASNALKKETEGSGLGLYLSKIIVESSGGKLSFVSNEGKGTTFRFTLPIKGTKRKQEKPA